MGQFSVEISCVAGSVLSGNQQTSHNVLDTALQAKVEILESQARQ